MPADSSRIKQQASSKKQRKKRSRLDNAEFKLETSTKTMIEDFKEWEKASEQLAEQKALAELELRN